MLILFLLLLVFREKCCANDFFYVTKVVKVGDHVKLNCSRRSEGEIVWMRIVSDHSPEILEQTENMTPRVKVKLEPGSLELKIAEAKLNDTGLYVCMRKKHGNLLSFNVTYLRVEEPAVTEAPPPTPSTPVYPRNSLTLQCSILHDSLKNSCLSNESMLCFSTELNSFYPNNTKDYSVNKEGKNLDGASVNKYFPSVFKNLTSSDGWTYYCAVPKCEEKTPEETSPANTPVCTWTSKDETVKNCLVAALVVSQVFIVFLLYLVKKLKTESRDSSHVPQQISTSTHSDQENQQENEDELVYAAPVFTGRKTRKTTKRVRQDQSEEIIYSSVLRL